MKTLKIFALVSLAMLAGNMSQAQSLYSNAVMNLNPVAYWPLQETTQPPSYDVETNYGSLGSIANAYYASTNAWHGQSGGIAGDGDTAVRFTAAAGSFAIVPTTDNRVSLQPGQPFTVECWVRPTVQSSTRGIITQTGPNNAGGLNGVNNSFGWSLNMGFAVYRGTGSGNTPPAWTFHVFNGVSGFNGGAEAEVPNTNCWLTGGLIDYTNSWVYIASVFDGTNCWMYVYSTNMNSSVSGTNLMNLQLPISNGPNAPVGGPPATLITNAQFAPDTWDPIQIAATRGFGANLFPAYMDEIAIYTNALTPQQITNHFSAGTNGLGNYAPTVLADNPAMYWRMDAPNWTNPPESSYPVAANYGSASSAMTNINTGGSGTNSSVYQPGTVPGVPGPSYPGFGSLTKACAFNGLVGAMDAGYNPLLDPTGVTNNFTMVAWFKGNPMDAASGNRNVAQNIASHTAKSWSASVKNGSVTATKGAGSVNIPLTSFNANDGNWHMVVMESTYAVGLTTNTSVSIDGGAAFNFVVNGSAIPGTNADVWIGGAQDFAEPTNEATFNTAEQYLAGDVCHVAYFTNALTTAQITALYSAARPQPIIGRQPQSGLAGAGGAYTNSVGATGQQLAYQWYKDNAPLANQTNASFILANVQPSDASTNYIVVITNSYGSVTSAPPVSLTVVSNVTIVAQYPITYTTPITLYGGQVVGGTNYLGSTPVFSVNVVGSIPISYQWLTNGVVFVGATNTSLTITNCQMTSPTSFACVITNSYGSLTSMVWSVSYTLAPMAPFPQAVLAASPVGYWRLNEADDGGYDGNQGAICNDYQSGDNGIYTNMYLHNVTIGTGYSPTTDPNEAAAEFGVYPTISSVNCDAFAINNVDVSVPLGGNGEFTVAVWANGNNFVQANNAGLVTKGLFSGEEFTLDEGSSALATGLRFYVRDALGNGYDASSSLALGNNSNWHFVVGVCDEVNGKTSLYVDGVPVGGATIPSGAGIINSATIPLMIGARAGSAVSGGNNQFRGLLNDAAVFNYAMSASQVANQYQSVVGPIAPQFVPPLPSTNAGARANTTLTIPVTAFGTPPIGYVWTNLTTGATVAGGVTNGFTLNAALVYGNVPAAWNTNQLELIVTNAYGATNVFVTLSITNAVNTNPTNIVFSASGGNLTLSWPTDHTGWTLQSQTNNLSVGISTNWVNVANSSATNQLIVPINLTNASVFYRLMYQQ
jgi:hypothetical protein